eukprot:6490623-Amphidinium_carterae.4
MLQTSLQPVKQAGLNKCFQDTSDSSVTILILEDSEPKIRGSPFQGFPEQHFQNFQEATATPTRLPNLIRRQLFLKCKAPDRIISKTNQAQAQHGEQTGGWKGKPRICFGKVSVHIILAK